MVSTAMPASIGGWATSCDPLVVEHMGRMGFDFIGLDLQHGQFGTLEASRALQVLALVGVRTFVRVSSGELPMVPRYLDFGAAGIIVATVDDAAVAARAVALSLYQPAGTRSYGGARFGLGTEPNDPSTVRPQIWAMIETEAGVRNLDAISAVPGLAGLAVGPADLARAYDLRPSQRNGDSRWNQSVELILRVARERGLASCQFATDGHDARRWIEMGFDHIILPSDLDLLRIGVQREITFARGADA